MYLENVNQVLSVVLAGVLIALFQISANAQSGGALVVQWTLEKTNKRLERLATIALTDPQGQPISNAKIEVDVDMPSMPMMHKVPKSIAEPTGEPGKYRTRFTLEMPGEWAAHIQVVAPGPVKAIKKFYAD